MKKLSNPKNHSRLSALGMLENQLSSGTKPLKIEGKTTTEKVALSDSDKHRIEKEISILKSRVILP